MRPARITFLVLGLSVLTGGLLVHKYAHTFAPEIMQDSALGRYYGPDQHVRERVHTIGTIISIVGALLLLPVALIPKEGQ